MGLKFVTRYNLIYLLILIFALKLSDQNPQDDNEDAIKINSTLQINDEDTILTNQTTLQPNQTTLNQTTLQTNQTTLQTNQTSESNTDDEFKSNEILQTSDEDVLRSDIAPQGTNGDLLKANQNFPTAEEDTLLKIFAMLEKMDSNMMAMDARLIQMESLQKTTNNEFSIFKDDLFSDVAILKVLNNATKNSLDTVTEKVDIVTSFQDHTNNVFNIFKENLAEDLSILKVIHNNTIKDLAVVTEIDDVMKSLKNRSNNGLNNVNFSKENLSRDRPMTKAINEDTSAKCAPFCKNGGTCEAHNRCSCTSGWTGRFCNIPTFVALKVGSCPEDFFRLGTECFLVVANALNFNQARAYCQRKNADLAQPNDLHLLSFYLKERGIAHNYWLGGSDAEREGSWKWFNGTTITQWAMGKPNGGTRENCLFFWSWRITNSLNDHSCGIFSKLRFICEGP